MSIQTKSTLKSYFNTGDTITEVNLASQIDTMVVEGGNAVIPDAIQTTNAEASGSFGSFAQGSNASATGSSGSFAQGNSVTATGNGSWAIGLNQTTTNANTETYSLQIGSGANIVRLLSQGVASTPRNGDIWFDGANLKFHANSTTYTVTATAT